VTTYLASVSDGFPRRSGDTQPYCSPDCRSSAWHEGSLPAAFRDDSSYEFTEHCAKCGRIIQARDLEVGDYVIAYSLAAGDRVVSVVDDVWSEGCHVVAVDPPARAVVTTEEAARRLRARYAPGIKEVR
jgi:hypothetical protein